jgi:uncharacterized protein YbbC (DUF1343 family)
MFKPGIEALFAHSHNKKYRVAAVTNFTGRTRDGRHLVNLLAEHQAFELVRIFTPEHGFTSDAPDGEHVADSRHAELEVPVVSLYGDQKKPKAELLHDLDILIYDIQDVGVRFYTYISTLRNILEAADECGCKVWILDRPDVLGGIEVEGPMLDKRFSSFVGHLPIPIRYGLTPGELALWYKDYAGLNLDLKIWQCENYECSNLHPAPNFPWFKPSPSMPDVDTAQFYPGTCLFEGTQLSEGRGSDAPFRIIGAPEVDSNAWARKLRELLPEHISVEECTFIPTFSKFSGEKCCGIRLSSQMPVVRNAVCLGIATIYAYMQTHPEQIDFTPRPGLEFPFFDYLCGTDLIRKGLVRGDKPDKILEDSSQGVEHFRECRKTYFLYQRAND